LLTIQKHPLVSIGIVGLIEAKPDVYRVFSSTSTLPLLAELVVMDIPMS
jgi:DNA-binding NarL/FixJ family response regulator